MRISKVSRFHGKWKKTTMLLKHHEFRGYIPPTARLSRAQLSAFLNRYGAVYVKPDLGRHGQGVMKVEKVVRSGQEVYTFHLEFTRKEFTSFEELYRTVAKYAAGHSYLVQKGIYGIRYRSRPFDIRVMVQKSPSGRWEATGKIGRLAHPRKIVSNYNLGRNGGTPMPPDTLLRTHLTMEQRNKLYARLDRLGCGTANYLQRTGYKYLKSIGLDVVLDRSMKPWILEVNTQAPNPYLFRHLKNKKVYSKILSYYKFYRRKSSANR